MKNPVEVFTDPAAFRRALAGTPRKAAKDARPGIPRGRAGEGDRTKALGRIAAHGFMPRWRAGAGFDFWNVQTGASTTAHASYRAAVLAAEREVKR